MLLHGAKPLSSSWKSGLKLSGSPLTVTTSVPSPPFRTDGVCRAGAAAAREPISPAAGAVNPSASPRCSSRRRLKWLPRSCSANVAISAGLRRVAIERFSAMTPPPDLSRPVRHPDASNPPRTRSRWH
jgi:hypothetical protein